ncbi:hypothetical protein FEM55_06655 [Dyadobacter sediminis]|uniref:SbsA Ig-like domain-containing protein n=1 Tax=Dyadobacter sediminis TaxID=1493691 RepID=A0A5R9KKQ6_9BACT|nr:hypothetical protein FEM55_06655 [Dyadobacter sediminis]
MIKFRHTKHFHFRSRISDKWVILFILSISFHLICFKSAFGKNKISAKPYSISEKKALSILPEHQPVSGDTITNKSVSGKETNRYAQLGKSGHNLNAYVQKAIVFEENEPEVLNTAAEEVDEEVNVLGVNVMAEKKMQLEVSVTDPEKVSAQHGGLFYGLKDKTFIKLGIAGNKIGLTKEKHFSSADALNGNDNERMTEVAGGFDSKTLRLKMVIDSAAKTVEGFYSTDGVNYVNTGSSYSSPALNISELDIMDSMVYAGVYTSGKKATQMSDDHFDDFAVNNVNVTLFRGIQADFQPEGTAVLHGHIADFGLPYDEIRKYGWVSTKTKQPVSVQHKVHLRKKETGSSKLHSAVEMQADNQEEKETAWELSVPNGFYRVTVSAGDSGYYNSRHQINVEGLPAISDFASSKTDQYRVGTATVAVNDGKLTVDALGGLNTRMNYITIDPAVPALDTIAPVANVRFEGKKRSRGGYEKEVRLFLSASDEGGSGLSEFQYALNDGKFKDYTIPFVIKKKGEYSLKVKAIDASNNETVTGTYHFSVKPRAVKKLAFTQDKIRFTVLKGKPVIPQTINLNAGSGNATFRLSKTKADWLTLPQTVSNTLQLGPENISSDLEPGNYQVLVTRTGGGFRSATMLIDLHVVEPLDAPKVNIDFADSESIPPVGYLKDYGQPFGQRSGAHQGAGFQFGWKNRADGSLLDLTANGRNRYTPEDVLLATLMHMQAVHIDNDYWPGVKEEGYWEMKVPNGVYDVTVSVGDGNPNKKPEKHSINVEGVKAISGFIPNGKKGTISRFKTVTVRVNVKDELLTIDANGGTSTKITFTNIVPVSIDPYVYWASKTQNIIVKKGIKENSSTSIVLGSSNNLATSFRISVRYCQGLPGWLKYDPNPKGIQPNVVFDYSRAENLPVGIYKAFVKATSPQFTGQEFEILLNVVDPSKPYVVSSNPLNGSVKVDLNTVSIAANNLNVPEAKGFKGGVDNSTITNNTVKLFKLSDNVSTSVNGVVQGTGGGDAISFSPVGSLEPNTIYKFVITSGVKSYTGASFAPYEATFTTDEAKIDSSNFLNAQFIKVGIPGTENKKYCSLTIGPDGKLYALRLDGIVERFDINHSSGMLSNLKTINTIVKKYGNRSAVGLAFDPKSTPSNLVLWISHSSPGLSVAPAFDGNISRLEGPELQKEQLVIIRLPRSKRDHLINSLAFGPDGALYMSQGSNSSAGSYDEDWQRNESLLSGTILRLDLKKLKGFKLPLNVLTTADQSIINKAPAKAATMRDGTYNPYGSSAPLTIYASGIRNAFDLLWHSNGQLYLPTNGSGGGGNSPESVAGTRKPDGTFYHGPEIPATFGIKAQNDWLFRINPNKPIGYFGHPNPLRGEYVINRGHEDNPLYLPSVTADPNYRQGYNFGLNKSPNGVIEYKSNTFNGALKGKLLVCRFSGGGDIAVMEPGSMVKTSNPADDSIYDIVKVNTGSGNNGLVGASGFGNPLDIVEDQVNGNLYVIEYNWNDSPNLAARITLLRVKPEPVTEPEVTASTKETGKKQIK